MIFPGTILDGPVPHRSAITGKLLGLPLSERELQVLRLISLGGKDVTAGRHLQPPVSCDTFRSHAKHVFAKLGADNRAHAVYLGFQSGWLVRPQSPPMPPQPALDLGERQLLRLLALGRTNGQIGGQIGVSTETVTNLISHLYRAMGATGRADAIRIGCLGGNLPFPDVPRRTPVREFRRTTRRTTFRSPT